MEREGKEVPVDKLLEPHLFNSFKSSLEQHQMASSTSRKNRYRSGIPLLMYRVLGIDIGPVFLLVHCVFFLIQLLDGDVNKRLRYRSPGFNTADQLHWWLTKETRVLCLACVCHGRWLLHFHAASIYFTTILSRYVNLTLLVL